MELSKNEGTTQLEHLCINGTHNSASKSFYEVIQSHQQDLNKNTLANENASPQAKLAAAQELAQQGQTEITIKDRNGQRKLRLEVEESQSGKKMVHVYANDENGKERIVLRGVNDGKGKFIRETDANGQQVSFNGEWWSKHEAGKSNLTGNENAVAAKSEAPGSADTAPGLPRLELIIGGRKDAAPSAKPETTVPVLPAQ
ncbi:MAG: hypothetical protein K2Z81_24370, partial [Cyanobacteria bacterium]|nr:hypothetical protein [Cyanobacteriota bacterium]